ncbi:hypothetical protein [Streptosporangium roseum]|uniref:hypothetical protein n=1 Tax=Streptosporangium roseum TaxID=2001 RepID=UPI0004CC9054|nr:hypothetical protein [Streptosporangium roseum]
MSPRTTRAWAAAGTVVVAALVNITTGVLTEKWTAAWCAFLAVLVVVGGALHAWLSIGERAAASQRAQDVKVSGQVRQRMGGSGEQTVNGSEIGADLIQEQG